MVQLVVLVLVSLLMLRWLSLLITLPIRVLRQGADHENGAGFAIVPVELPLLGAIIGIILFNPEESLWGGRSAPALWGLLLAQAIAYVPCAIALMWVRHRRARKKERTDPMEPGVREPGVRSSKVASGCRRG